jgi:hypothetical protein
MARTCTRTHTRTRAHPINWDLIVPPRCRQLLHCPQLGGKGLEGSLCCSQLEVSLHHLCGMLLCCCTQLCL